MMWANDGSSPAFDATVLRMLPARTTSPGELLREPPQGRWRGPVRSRILRVTALVRAPAAALWGRAGTGVVDERQVWSVGSSARRTAWLHADGAHGRRGHRGRP